MGIDVLREHYKEYAGDIFVYFGNALSLDIAFHHREIYKHGAVVNFYSSRDRGNGISLLLNSLEKYLYTLPDTPRVKKISIKQFNREVVNAEMEDRVEELKVAYRNFDYLILDDAENYGFWSALNPVIYEIVSRKKYVFLGSTVSLEPYFDDRVKSLDKNCFRVECCEIFPPEGNEKVEYIDWYLKKTGWKISTEAVDKIVKAKTNFFDINNAVFDAMCLEGIMAAIDGELGEKPKSNVDYDDDYNLHKWNQFDFKDLSTYITEYQNYDLERLKLRCAKLRRIFKDADWSKHTILYKACYRLQFEQLVLEFMIQEEENRIKAEKEMKELEEMEE